MATSLPVQASLLGEETAEATTLSTQEAARLAKVSQRVVQRWAKQRLIMAARGPSGYRVDVQSLTTYLAQRPASQTPARVPAARPAGVVSPPACLVLEAFDAAGLREIIRMFERELADAKAEKSRLLEILDHAQTRGRREPTSPAALMRDRILEYLDKATRPRRTWQIWQDLGLERSPTRELSRLYSLGKIVRLEPGLYTMPGRAAPGPSEEECCD